MGGFKNKFFTGKKKLGKSLIFFRLPADNLLAWVGVDRPSISSCISETIADFLSIIFQECYMAQYLRLYMGFFNPTFLRPLIGLFGHFFTCRAQYLQKRSSISEFLV